MPPFPYKVLLIYQEGPEPLEEPSVCNNSTPLPVLCVEDGMVILRFSQIFGLHEPLKKPQKRDRKYPVPKGILFLYLKVLKNSTEDEFWQYSIFCVYYRMHFSMPCPD